jgi:hypothetical protein
MPSWRGAQLKNTGATLPLFTFYLSFTPPEEQIMFYVIIFVLFIWSLTIFHEALDRNTLPEVRFHFGRF